MATSLTKTVNSLRLKCPSLSFCTKKTEAINLVDNEFNTKILEYLVCPLTKEPLEYDKTNNVLISAKIGMAYHIVKGIPLMDPNRAIRLKDLKVKTEQTLKTK